MEENKVVALNTLKIALDKIKENHPTKTEVTQQIESASLSGGITYATEEDVLAMFEDSTAGQEA